MSQDLRADVRNDASVHRELEPVSRDGGRTSRDHTALLRKLGVISLHSGVMSRDGETIIGRRSGPRSWSRRSRRSPGKEGSYGDAVNWECLLAEVPAGQDLHLITRDRGFASRIDRTRLSPFLEEEWRERKGARIFFYARLSAFCRDHLPEVRLAGDSTTGSADSAS